jgi:predicted nucleotidyltransferase
MTIELKGLSREQVTNLLPEGLISLCWRGSVAHGMYVPKSDPDSIDDKDLMGVYIAPIEHYLGFARRDVYEKWEGEWDCVFYELRKFIGLLLNCNPNVLSLLCLKDNGIIYESPLWADCFAKTATCSLQRRLIIPSQDTLTINLRR